jgi:8-hydroxy-5-deazaflavin:NADPH oxidoreductase
MTTAIIGLGNIGSRVAGLLVAGGERVILADNDPKKAEAVAVQLGALAKTASVENAIHDADAIVLAVYMDAEKSLITANNTALVGKVVIDPSNPVAPDGKGGFGRTLPAGTSAGSVIAGLLPAGAHFVKAFGTLGASSLEKAANRKPERATLFYATDDAVAATTIERLITAAGFAPVKAGGVTASLRIEVGGNLHELGGLNGRWLSAAEAHTAVAQFVVTLTLIVADIRRSVAFYRDVLGATVLREGEPTFLRFGNIWLTINRGGGGTDDKPDVTAAPPTDLNQLSRFLNLRVVDIKACYDLWRSRGAPFITEPKVHATEMRCYMRDPDGYLIEVGQTTMTATPLELYR